MSPFKGTGPIVFFVIRCRYYTEDGRAVPPYCSAGRHCTFLHPSDKGWPGGDPLPEIQKKSEERDGRPRPRSFKSPPDRLSSSPQERRLSRGGAATISKLDFCASENPSPWKGTSYPHKEVPLPVQSIVEILHDVAKLQIRLIQDKDSLDKTTDKLTSFRELSKSLSKVSATSAAAVAPTIDAIVNARQDLQKKIDGDSKQLSSLWDGIFDIFLRAICRQFDDELESGIDYLRQEAHVQLKSFQRNASSFRHLGDTTAARSSLLPSQSTSQVVPPPERSDAVPVAPGGSAKDLVPKESYASGERLINPPVGASDNGWGRKRRRVSSASQGHDGHSDEQSQMEGKDSIAELQKQLQKQNEKIAVLSKRTEELESTVRTFSSLIPAITRPPHTDYHPSVPSTLSDDQFSQIRETLRKDVLALISPSLEQQTKVNEIWEVRLNSLDEKLQEKNTACSAMEEVITTTPSQVSDFRKHQDV